MDRQDVEQAVAEMVQLLTPHESRDWQGRLGRGMELLDDSGPCRT
jgi:hypothetical protein